MAREEPGGGGFHPPPPPAEIGLSMFISLPISIHMGTVSLAGVSVSGVVLVLTKKYPKKLVKATKLIDIVTSALALFETLVPKVLKDGKINELEFNMIQNLYYESLNDPSDIDHKMEAEIRSQLQKSLQEEINNLLSSAESFFCLFVAFAT